MKKGLFSILYLVFLSSTNLHSQGIDFKVGSWEEIIQLAQTEDKMILVDAYTDWCGWCKKMDKATFQTEEVGKVVNESLIAVKINFEKGEGRKLASKYRVTGFPTLLFFNKEGRLIYREAGYKNIPSFLQLLSKAQNPKYQFQYPGDPLNFDLEYPEFYLKAVAPKDKRVSPNFEDVLNYLNTQENMFTEVNWVILNAFNLDQKWTLFFLENMSKYRQLFGADEVRKKADRVITDVVKGAAFNKNKEQLQIALQLVDKYLPQNAPLTKVYLNILYFENTNEWMEYAKTIDQLVQIPGYSDDHRVQGYIRTIKKATEDPEILIFPYEWSKKIAERDPKAYQIHSAAELGYKCGKKHEALELIEKAIEIGQQTGVNVSSYKTLKAHIEKL